MRIATGKTDITPQQPVPLAGFAHRLAPIGSVSSVLEANAIAFCDHQGRWALVLSLDLLFVGEPITKAVHAFCGARHGIRPQDIVIVASHTHYAPATDPAKPLLGHVDPDYLRFVIDRIEQMLGTLLTHPPEAAVVEKETGMLPGNVNRRLPWLLPRWGRQRIIWGEPVMAPNMSGDRDETATIYTFSDGEGAPNAIIWHWACHPSLYPDYMTITADFVGEVRAGLCHALGKCVPVIFLQGFAGDLFPYVGPTRFPPPSQWPWTLVAGLSTRGFDVDGYRAWVKGLVEKTTDIQGRGGAKAQTGGVIRSASAAVPLSQVVEGCGRDTSIGFGRLQIGDVLELVSVEAEPLVGLRHMVPFADSLCVGYIGTPFGYWPTEEQRRQGGYEAHGFLKPFGLQGALAPDLDTIFRGAMEPLRNLD